ncbi:hypothetical protein GKZ90_0009910 [Flavobacterium sp. MC2016-06]|jgi:hypothetical protein|uniref:hypothetical protein n=1 Tax=Flavobacterium sp. MC2016-06 TaxID=2676308 RepID=UPI0012BAAA06|nr:hypothetical protein [Flavobacterium sp. MC2016-06]MBU3859768.1 hypothetical protein [Flavobacterium sp. MC2016-06]
MKKIFLILVLILAISSCKKADVAATSLGPNIYFESPQPINDSELDHFPNKFKGLYMDKDSTFLRINENVAQYEKYYKLKIHKDVLDSLPPGDIIKDNKLVVKEWGQTFDMYPKGDSILLVSKSIDTIFRFSYYQKAKRINGDLVISKKDSIFWNVETFSINNNDLKFRTIGFEDIKKIDSITAVKSKMLDSMSYLLKPTRKEFGRILKIKDLGYLQEFKKVKS